MRRVLPGLIVLSLALLSLAEPANAAGQAAADSTLFLNGSVRQRNGSPPARQLQVELVCGDRVQQQVFTSETGFFSFTIERSQQQGWTDASVGRDGDLNRDSHWNSSGNKTGVFAESHFKTFNLSGCRIRLTGGQGYSATQIQLANRSVFDSPETGVLVLAAGEERRDLSVRVTTLRAPSGARKAFEKAQAELAKEEPDHGKAIQHFQTAIREYPEFAEAWFQLGELLGQEKNFDEAQHAYEQAVEQDPDFVEPYLSLARLALFREDWQLGADLSEQVLSRDPAEVKAHYYKGLANYFLGRLELAEEGFLYIPTHGYSQAHPLALFHLAVIHARAGRIQEAGDEFSLFLGLMPEGRIDPGQKERIEQQLIAWKAKGLWNDNSAGGSDASPDPQ